MKKQFKIVLIMLGFTIFNLSSCREKDDYEKLLKETPVKQEFATNPPVAKEITLQLLDKSRKEGNFLLTANLKGQNNDQYLAYEADEQKILLRDDGAGADSVKGDGIFSAFVNMDTSEVIQMVNDQNASIARASSLEASTGDIKNILRFISFDKKDTTGNKASHSLVLNHPGVIFDNRFVEFNPEKPKVVDAKKALMLKTPIHFFPNFLCPSPPADLIAKSLMITDLSVVEDNSRTWNPVSRSGNINGAWTFNNLINHMANKAATGISSTQFVLTWLQTWLTDFPLNGDNAPARPMINNLINSWKQRSAAKGLPDDTLDMSEAPFKLLAIVNRIDLRENAGYSTTNAGEGRFVFCVMNSNNTAVLNSPQRFTVIFEYGINRKGCKNVQLWGQQWYDLHNQIPGSVAYNNALQSITEQFVNANTSPSKPNGSSLNQLRTDELALGNPWQLREFNIDAASHLLKLVTVKKTPRDPLNNTPFLASFINANCPAITANNYNVPETFSGQPLLGVKSDNPLGNPWNAAITCADPVRARRVFSLNTCNACHGVETQTFFTHVNPSPFGAVAGLSGFLTGETINDPVAGTPVSFADLDERAKGLQNLVCQMCRIFGPLVFRPKNMTH